MDFDFKHNSKINGLNYAAQLEADHMWDAQSAINRKLQQKRREEELKRSCYGHLDPTNMKFDLPDPPQVSGNVSFDPEFMVFHQK